MSDGIEVNSCSRCRSDAIVHQVYSGQHLCGKHLAESIRKRTSKELRSQLELPKNALRDDGSKFRILIAIFVLVTAEVISRTVPKGPLGPRNPEFTQFVDKDGSVQKIALVDCSCDGACPSFKENWLHQKIPILRPSALCLDENEQLALREMVQRNSLTRLTITGCNGYPLPIDIRSYIESNQTELDGLNWLDEENSNLPNWRKQSLQFYSSEYRRLP